MSISTVFKKITRDVLVNSVAASYLIPVRFRLGIYKIYGMDIKNAHISPKCYFGGNNVKIGSGTFLNYSCWFDLGSNVEIGDNCSIGLDVLFCTSTHEVSGTKKRAGRSYGLPISVGSGSWIASRATILPGVTIGEGCVIAAGALVNKDCSPNGMYAGVPAKRIKDLS